MAGVDSSSPVRECSDYNFQSVVYYIGPCSGYFHENVLGVAGNLPKVVGVDYWWEREDLSLTVDEQGPFFEWANYGTVLNPLRMLLHNLCKTHPVFRAQWDERCVPRVGDGVADR